MRFMILIKADKNTEAGAMPDEQLLADMGAYNKELIDAGVLLAGEGLQASSKGARVRFSGAGRTVTDGPFAETKELIAGYWMWQVKSKEEAIEWVKRCPNPTGDESEIEIRQVFELADFGDALTPELQEQEERLRDQAAKSAHDRKAPALQVNPYLTFSGQCEEAFRFYERCLGGTIETMMPHAGTPVEAHMPPAWRDKILHARMTVGEQVLMGSDAPPDRYQAPRGISVSLQIGGVAEAERVFQALAENGKVQMPLQETFWAARFGAVTDRFGTPWMINCER
ncbi:MAG: YciI family protein [Acidobacteriota bacterium]